MFWNDYKLFWTNYANFKGRTPRHGFWFAMLWHAIIYCVGFLLMMPFGLSGSAGLGIAIVLSFALGLYTIAILIPVLSLTVRRLHDIGKRATWLWFISSPNIAMFIFQIIAFLTSLTALGSSSNSLGYSPYSPLASSYGSAQALYGLSAVLILFLVLIVVYGSIVNIITLVWMATDTTPNAIGICTHGGGCASDSSNSQFSYGSTSRKPFNANPASASFALPEVASPTITGIEGMYSGYSIPLSPGKEFVMGRDSALSSIVIDQKAGRVSRKHCGIIYDSSQGSYYVRDYSTNGTFCTDGSRLLANVLNSVKRGTIINLGSAENSFRLE